MQLLRNERGWACFLIIVAVATLACEPPRGSPRRSRCPESAVQICKKIQRGEARFRNVEELRLAMEKCAQLKQRGCY